MWSLLLLACGTEVGSGPFWDMGAAPQPGYTYEGRIAALVVNGVPSIPMVDASNLHLITWPEGTVVPATLSWLAPRASLQEIELEPESDLELHRWYAIRWDSPEPVMPSGRNYRLRSGVQLDEDSFAWPFWSTPGPIAFSLVWYRDTSSIVVHYSDAVEPGPDFAGSVTQGDIVCRLDSARTGPMIEGGCWSLDVARPVRLHVSGLLSAGTGVELPPLDREVMLVDDGAQLSYPLVWPAFEGVP